MKKLTDAEKDNVQALMDSIEHWERMRDDPRNRKEQPVSGDCACCQLHPMDCDGCPVYWYTGKGHCYGTVFYEASDAWEKRHWEQFSKIADVMVDQLKEVLEAYKEFITNEENG